MAGNFAHTKTQSHKDLFATRSEILGRNQLGGRRDPHREPPILQNRQFCGKGHTRVTPKRSPQRFHTCSKIYAASQAGDVPR
jgi:hypothetical protein